MKGTEPNIHLIMVMYYIALVESNGGTHLAHILRPHRLCAASLDLGSAVRRLCPWVRRRAKTSPFQSLLRPSQVIYSKNHTQHHTARRTRRNDYVLSSAAIQYHVQMLNRGIPNETSKKATLSSRAAADPADARAPAPSGTGRPSCRRRAWPGRTRRGPGRRSRARAAGPWPWTLGS